MQTDPIADMLTRIRNANKAMHETAQMPTSRMKEEIARLLKEEGYIKDFRVEQPARASDTLVVELKFGRNRERVLTDLKRVSKPGRRVYARKDRLPRVLGGLGTAILSTSSGLVTARDAAAARHRRRGHLLRLVAHEPHRKTAHRGPRRRERRDLARARAGQRPARRAARRCPARMTIEQRGRRASSSRARPSAARTVRCTGSRAR